MKHFRIGIDPGTITGFALSEDKKLTQVMGLQLIKIIRKVENILDNLDDSDNVEIIVEDARLRAGSIKRAQGAGSIKRDCAIWEEVLSKYKDCHNVKINFVKPDSSSLRQMCKKNAHYFWKVTKWPHRTNNHGRDAAMLIYEI